MRFIDEMIDRKRREARRTDPGTGAAPPEAGPPPGFDRSDLPAPLDWPPQPGRPLSGERETPSLEASAPGESPAPRFFGRAGAGGGDRATGRPISEPQDPIVPPDDPADDRLAPRAARPASAAPLQLVDPVRPGRDPLAEMEGAPAPEAPAPEAPAPESRAPESPVPEAPVSEAAEAERPETEPPETERPETEPPAPEAGPAFPAPSSEAEGALPASAWSEAPGPAPTGAAAPSPFFPGPETGPEPEMRAAPLAGPDRLPARRAHGPDLAGDPPAFGVAPTEALSGRRDAPRPAGRVKTRLLGFRAPDKDGDPVHQPRAAAAAAAPARFPVGWLVVERGPGRGTAFSLFDGLSTIGRGEGQTVQLDLGDTAISRDTHAAIAYDDENRACYLGHGGKANLVRLNGRPVLTTEPLSGGDRIRIGETTLRFVALCGPEFSWSDSPHPHEEAHSNAAAL